MNTIVGVERQHGHWMFDTTSSRPNYKLVFIYVQLDKDS